MTLAGLILAAGWGRRMGRPKALLPLAGGGTALSVLADTLLASDVAPIVVVVGPWWCSGDRFVSAGIVVNPDPDRGQASSIRCGLEALPSGQTGVMVAPVDHPFVRVETIRSLAAEHAAHPDAIVLPVVGGRRGHPVVFPAWALPLLSDPALDGVGARAVVRAYTGRIREVTVTDEAVRMDFDTQDGYLRVENRGGPWQL